MPQKFHRGDVVKVADDLGPSMSHFDGAGEEAIVMGSYQDQYGGRGSANAHYTLLLKDHGEVSWYYESQLTFLRHDESLIQNWTDEIDRRAKEQSDLMWIVTNWAERKDDLPGASCEALMKLCGINNPWGSHGEGMTWYLNATVTLAALRPALDSGSVEAVRAKAEQLRSLRHG